ncbi:MAG TPA: MarR family transcriptional regulator, partial [Mycobacterium sp.]|nr:MarR family transcriptional regulator [Mycobacterium sp.]
DLGRSTVEDATITLNNEVFSDLGMSAEQSGALVASIGVLRHSAGDF